MRFFNHLQFLACSSHSECDTHVSRGGEGGFTRLYKHTSSAAALWYTLGVFDWLCVDLPITCVENSLALCGEFIVCVFDTPDQAVASDLPNGGLQRRPIIHNVIKNDNKAQQDEWYRQKEIRCSP